MARIQGLSRYQQVPSLLSKFRQKVDDIPVDAPPIASSEEEIEEDELNDLNEHQSAKDSSDDSRQGRADIRPTSFKTQAGKTSTSKGRRLTTASTESASPVSAKEPYSSARRSSRQAQKAIGSAKTKRPAGSDDIDDSNDESPKATKRAKSERGPSSANIGRHHEGDIFIQPKKARNTYGNRDKSSRSSQDDRVSPVPQFRRRSMPQSAENSPEKQVVFKKRNTDAGPLSSPSMSPPKLKLLATVNKSSGVNKQTKKIRAPKLRHSKARDRVQITRASPDSEPSQIPVFKLPNGFDSQEQHRDLLANDDMASLSDTLDDSASATSLRRDEPASTPPVCPFCNDTVDEGLLRDFSKNSRMNISQQAKFCRLHKKRTAEHEWHSRGYPDIKWDEFESRVAGHRDFLEALIQGKSSDSAESLKEKIKDGKNRTLFKTEESLTPGYYGVRGLRAMTETIIKDFSGLIKKRAVQDRLISSRGHTIYIQAVLVPELCVRLIQEDMGVGEDDARAIMKDSRSLGDLLNDDKGDRVTEQKVRDHDQAEIRGDADESDASSGLSELSELSRISEE